MTACPHVFSDLDGPILDVSEKYYQVYAHLVQSHGKQPLSKDDYWTFKRQRVRDQIILGKSQIEQWTDEFRRLRRGLIEAPQFLAFDRVWDGTFEMLSALGDRHPLILVTLRSSRPALLKQLEALKLIQCFRHVLSASGDGAVDKAVLKAQLVRNHIGADVFDGWFIGDTETDIRAGQMLGLRTAGVSFGIRTAEHLSRLSPTRLFGTPAELLNWSKSTTL